MSEKQTSETDGADNVEDPETGTETETETEETEDETSEDSEDEASKVTPREKELRRLLRENEKELRRLRKAEEDDRRKQMSEAEKLREENSELSEKLSTLTRKAIAAENGLDESLAGRLVGATEEELREDAERLAALLTPPKPKSKDVGLGVPGGDSAPTDPVAAHRAATAGRRF